MNFFIFLIIFVLGGADKIMAKGKELYNQGKYLEATEILNKLVFAEPQNQAAKNLLADTFEQIGYLQESTGVRNSFLQGAYELRTGLPAGVPPRTTGPDVIRAMPTDNWLDFLGISIDPKKAENLKFTINLVTPDNGEKYLVEMSNGTLTNIKGVQAKNGDRKPFEQLRGILVEFTPDFEILPGTVKQPNATHQNPNPFKLPDILPPDSAGD